MIDWSKLSWTAEELTGVKEIRLTPTVSDDSIIVAAEWVYTDGPPRKDIHVEVLKLPGLTGAAEG